METIHLGIFVILCLGVDRSSSGILQRQKRDWIIDSFSISEGYKGPFPYTLGKIQVEKEHVFFEIHGQGVKDEPKDILEINKYTGDITVTGPVDYEQFKVLKLSFQAYDRDSHTLDTALGVELRITDVNDNPPKFENEMYEISIKESTPQGTAVITLKASDADISEKYNTFDLRIVSVTPKPQDLQFYLSQVSDSQTGTISFKGCLDYEKSERYTIIVEAKDRGEEVQLSSSGTVIIHIEDGNNHVPEITGLTGPRRVKEGQQGVLVSRLQVADKDTKGTPAWRAKYQIHGDTNNNFRITTDTETNEGLLYLEKPLDYENEPLKIVNISVENEIPLFSCKVETRGTSTTGLWKVIYGDAGTMRVMGPSTHQVTVTVEDVNEPPIFDEPNKHVSLVENVAAGHLLTTFTARDPDVNNTLVYKKGEDPAGWFTVDSGNGQITTIKGIDRESSFVNDNIYVVTVYAVDSGEPPMTGTATLSVHITDENDNVPILTASTIDMCQSQGPSRANITAVDLDQQPYSGPFSFKLHGDVKGQWKVDPVQGYSVNLVKENTVHSGHYELLLEVSDLQGKAAVHNLSVTVCNCLDTAKPNCRFRKSTASASGGGVLGIILFCILLLAGMLLLAFLMTCKKKHAEIPDDGLGQQLMKSNTEKLGNDCEVEFDSYSQNGGQIKTVSQVTRKPSFNKPPVFTEHASSGYGVPRAEILTQRNPFHWGINDSVSEASQTRTECYLSQGKSSGEQPFSGRNSARWSIAASSPTRMRYEHRNSLRGRQLGHSKYSADQENVIQQELLVKVLNKMLYTLQAPGEELGDYAPHAYAEEGDIENSSELDAISIPDVSFDPDKDLNLDLNFSNLASVCIPDERT